jgi:hypothetical protein
MVVRLSWDGFHFILLALEPPFSADEKLVPLNFYLICDFLILYFVGICASAPDG